MSMRQPSHARLSGKLAALLVHWAEPSYAIINGAPVTGNDFASTLFLTTAAGSCSATLIGPRVLLTAASCVIDVRDMRVGQNATKIKCDHQPDYNKTTGTADTALCLLESELAGVPSERIATDTSLKIESIVLVGFGCTKKDGVDRQLGQLTSGPAKLTKPVPANPDFLVVAGASLCFGDGGGGAYTPLPKRQLVGVNSRGDLSGTSFIWPIANLQFLNWAKTWSSQNNAKICGLDESACRPGGGLSIVPDQTADVLAQVGKGLQAQAVIATSLESGPGNRNDLQRVTRVNVRKGSTARETAALICGAPQNEDYFDQFDQYQLRAGASLNRDTRFDQDMVIDFPACGLSKPTFETVVTAQSDYTWRYYDRILKRKLSPPWKDFDRPGGMIVKDENSVYFLDVLAALNPGIDVLSLPENYNLRIPLFPKKAVAPQFAASVQPTVQPIFSLQSAKDDCTTPSQFDGYPFDPLRVLDVLRTNVAARTNTRSSVGVLIADSGLLGAGRGIFPESVLLKTGPIDTFAQGVDPTYLLGGNEASHGTEVASVAVGGSLLGRVNAISFTPRVQLVVMPIYRNYALGGTSWVGTKEDLFSDIIEAAKKHGPSIINLSIKTQAQIPTLLNQLNDTSPFLFVVAAGNLEPGATQRLGEDGSTPIFPAMYGGAGAGLYNLISVAALDWKDTSKKLGPASFTHTGAEWIELAAPGCKIAVTSYDVSSRAWILEHRSGTSFAAPLVSFAGALLKSERPPGGTPVDLKRRLLISADLDPDLASDVQDGRILDIAKAVAIENDVIELIKDKRLVIGRLSLSIDGQRKVDSSSIQLKCPSSPVSIKIADLLKVRPKFRVDQGVTLAKVYVKSPPGVAVRLFRTLECELPDTLRVVMHDNERDSEESFGVDELSDLVRKDQ